MSAKDLQPLEPITILLVEDSAEDVRITRRALERGGLRNQLKVARDGAEALDYLFRRPPFDAPNAAPTPDLILLDLNLPRVDGRQVLSQIKSDAELRRIPVIVLTTSTRDEDVLNTYELGVNTYIPKPVEFERFLEVVSTINEYWIFIARLPPRREHA